MSPADTAALLAVTNSIWFVGFACGFCAAAMGVWVALWCADRFGDWLVPWLLERRRRH